MKMEKERVYINGLLEPLKSEYDTKFTMYPYRMIPNSEILGSYHVDINGLEDRNINDNQSDMLAKVDLFNNKISSNNITDLFSFLDYEVEYNITTYTHYSKIKNLKYCPDILGLLDLKERYTPLALQNISTKLYIDIYEKYTNLLNILSH